MRPLRKKYARLRFAARNSRSSHLGVSYLLALTVTFGVIFWIVFNFFKYNQNCQPVWWYWLSGLRHHTSVIETTAACFVGLTILISISFVGYLRMKSPVKVSDVTIYFAILAYPASMLFALYLLWGAMIPMSVARPVYQETIKTLGAGNRIETPSGYQRPGEPYGTCSYEPQLVYRYYPSQPDTIGAL